jgi:anti-sigma factor ChrR (cupin superfamily)
MRVPDLEVCDWADAYAVGALDSGDRSTFEGHLAGCAPCRGAVAEGAATLGRMTSVLAGKAPEARLRQEVLDLAEAPPLPLDLRAFDWQEIAPGIRVHVVREEPSRGMRACLVWADPGATHSRHRHLGNENILVLQGALRDERGTYGPGEICRSRTDSVHSEEALPGDDCVCYVVYYGDLEAV